MAGIDYGNILNSGNTTNNGYIPCLIYKSGRFYVVYTVYQKKKSGEDYIAPLEAILVH